MERELVHYGIVTALPKEHAAMKAMLDRVTDYAPPVRRPRAYVLGDLPAKGGGTHRVALAQADQGTANAATVATLMSEDFPEATAILMVGIAGGVPCVERPEVHVRLGDIVVSGEHGVVAYDFVKEHRDSLEPRHPPRPPDATLLKACQSLESGRIAGSRPWLTLLPKAAHLDHSARPPSRTDRLAETRTPWWRFLLGPRRLQHPPDPARSEGEPRVFLGTIACANRLLKNPVRRDQLREQFAARAIEMEGFGIAEATWFQQIGYIVVRGVCDYCDKNKGDSWQGYAAVVAAAFARALLSEVPPRTTGPNTLAVAPSAAFSSEELVGFARSLISANSPPSIAALFGSTSAPAQRALEVLGRVPRTYTHTGKSAVDSKKGALLSDVIASEGMHHLLVAAPGSGKTHALWRAAGIALANAVAVPVYVVLEPSTSWFDVERSIADITHVADVNALLADGRVCVFLDGWTEFDPAEQARAMRALHATRVVATGRPSANSDPRFKIWELDPLPTDSVLRVLDAAGAGRPKPELLEFLRLPLALCIQLLLGGSNTSRGQLLAAFHAHLARSLPERFREVLAGAAGALAAARQDRIRPRLDHELRVRAADVGIDEPLGLLSRLGTLGTRPDVIVPVHDLYWSWLVGVGIILEGRLEGSVGRLSTRESVALALESGLRPAPELVERALRLDIVLAAQLAAHVSVEQVSRRLREQVLSRVATAPLANRARLAVAALKTRDPKLLGTALAVLTSLLKENIYPHALVEALEPDALYAERTVLAGWLGQPGTPEVLNVIAEGGDARWEPWLHQVATAGKITFEVATACALAVTDHLPEWAVPHLQSLCRKSAYLLRTAAHRGVNRPLARWVAEHYAEYAIANNGTFVTLNKVLVRCGDRELFEFLIERLDSMPHKIQELLDYTFVELGDPWLGRAQKKAFAQGEGAHLTLLDKVSSEVDDATARGWIARGPCVLGWRVLIARHQNAMVQELIAALPDSFDGLHAIPPLKAMRDLEDPPEELATEVLLRIRGNMQPMAMDDALHALARVRRGGLPAIVNRLSRDPDFLPPFHLARFVKLLLEWQRRVALEIRVKTADGELAFAEWVVLHQFLTAKVETLDAFGLRELSRLHVDILLRHFDSYPSALGKHLLQLDHIDVHHSGLVERMLTDPKQAARVPKVFAKALGAFSEPELERVLSVPKLDLSQFVQALADSSNPLHLALHEKVVQLVRAAPFEIGSYRAAAEMLRVHTRGELLGIFQRIVVMDRSEGDHWLIREVEKASGELLLDEDGAWLPA